MICSQLRPLNAVLGNVPPGRGGMPVHNTCAHARRNAPRRSIDRSDPHKGSSRDLDYVAIRKFSRLCKVRFCYFIRGRSSCEVFSKKSVLLFRFVVFLVPIRTGLAGCTVLVVYSFVTFYHLQLIRVYRAVLRNAMQFWNVSV